jgi:hypothetical protein
VGIITNGIGDRHPLLLGDYHIYPSILKNCLEIVKNWLGKYLDLKLAERLLDTASGEGSNLFDRGYCESITPGRGEARRPLHSKYS